MPKSTHLLATPEPSAAVRLYGRVKTLCGARTTWFNAWPADEAATISASRPAVCPKCAAIQLIAETTGAAK